ANLVGIALYNSRLYSDVAQRYRTLADVLEKITQNLGAAEEDMFLLFHNAAKAHIESLQNMYIALYDRIDDQLRFPYVVINSERRTLPSRGVQSGKGNWGRTEHLIDEATKNNVDRLIHNTKEESKKWYEDYGHKDHLGNQPFSSYLGVPIKLDQRIFGVIAVYDDDNEYVYGENEFNVLNSLARILAIVLEAREKREQQRAESAFTALGLSSSIILHRLRNLIAPITLDVMRLQPRVQPMTAEVDALLNKIDRAAENSVHIISRLADQVREMESEPQDITSRLEEIVQTIQEANDTVTLHNNVTDELPLVEAPTFFVTEIFTNLIENACRALPNGGDVFIDLDRNASPDFITISITDTGEGVPEHLQKRLFKKPMPYSNPKNPERQTLGLGLYLTYLQIRKLGGNLHYVSKEHRNPDEPQGAKFVVEFPVNRVAD
ncbi:MAG: GAF domain-containing protein, partial [Anaerolinea sp.]|nr:GAF domain-containing protein [Anaerolinea sp.]